MTAEVFSLASRFPTQFPWRKSVPEAILEPMLRKLRLQKVENHIPPGSEVLDVGCGRNAVLLRYLSQRIKRGVGIDGQVVPFTEGNLHTMQVRLDKTLPFEDESFDVVTMLAVLEHIENEKHILQEIHRVLRPGGKLVLTVPSVWAQPVLEFLAYRLNVVDEPSIRDHKRYYTRESLRKVLIEATQFQQFQHHYFQLWMNNFCFVRK